MSARPSRSPDLVDVLAAIESLREDFARLRETLAARKAPSDEQMAAALVPLLRDHVGDLAFSAAELVEHLATTRAAALRAALGAPNGRRIGRLLRRVENVEVGGLVLRRIGADSSGIIWRVSRVSNP